MDLSLRSRFVIILLLASLPGMLVALMLAVNALANQREQIETNARRLADIQAAQHTNVVENAHTMLDTMVEVLASRDLDGSDCTHFLSDWVERYPSFTTPTLLDPNGQTECANENSEFPESFPDDELAETLRVSQELVVGEYAVDSSGEPLIVAALPVRSDGDRYEGAVAVGIDLGWLEFLAQRMNLPTGSTVTAIDQDGNVLNHYRAENFDEGELEASEDTVAVQALREEMASRGQGVVRGPTEAGHQRVFGFQRTETGNMGVVVGMPQYLQFERYGAALRDTLLAPMGILVLALLAAGYASQRLVIRWVQRLTTAARKMEQGDLDARSHVPHARYELGRLAAAFDGMAQSIQQKQQEIHTRAEQYRELFRELHHRVSNNMQMIRSLIRIRAKRVTDREARNVIIDIEERLAALTEIQRLLYSQDDAEIDTSDYAKRLGSYLQSIYSSDGIAVEVDIEQISLPRAAAIPLGLAMNELIANARKHAFPDGSGTVRVNLHQRGETGHLVVADDGAPLPEEIADRGQRRSLGLRIVRSMAEQLGGELLVKQEDGEKSFHIAFPLADRAQGEETGTGEAPPQTQA